MGLQFDLWHHVQPLLGQSPSPPGDHLLVSRTSPWNTGSFCSEPLPERLSWLHPHGPRRSASSGVTPTCRCTAQGKRPQQGKLWEPHFHLGQGLRASEAVSLTVGSQPLMAGTDSTRSLFPVFRNVWRRWGVGGGEVTRAVTTEAQGPGKVEGGRVCRTSGCPCHSAVSHMGLQSTHGYL